MDIKKIVLQNWLKIQKVKYSLLTVGSEHNMLSSHYAKVW
jgi:hypothetical protein